MDWRVQAVAAAAPVVVGRTGVESGGMLLPSGSTGGFLVWAHHSGVSELVAISTLRVGRCFSSLHCLLQTQRYWCPRDCKECCPAMESTTVFTDAWC